jgi:DNA-binding transcriptional LysR family regulator
MNNNFYKFFVDAIYSTGVAFYATLRHTAHRRWLSMKVTAIDQISSLKINELLIFVELSQVRSVREIARRRKVDPATISRVLMRVEKALGRKLFTRSADGIHTNEVGDEVIEKCRQLLSALEGISPGSESQEILSFGCISFLSTRFLAAKIDELVKVAKGQVRLIDFPPDELISAGLKGAFNVALHFGQIPWPPATWTSVPLGEVSWGLYCRHQHPLARKNKVSDADVLQYPFIYPIYFSSKEVTIGNDQLPIPLFKRKKAVGTATAEAALVSLQQTDLLAYLPSIITADVVSKGEVKLLETPWKDETKSLYLTARSDTLSASKFRELTRVLKLPPL